MRHAAFLSLFLACQGLACMCMRTNVFSVLPPGQFARTPTDGLLNKSLFVLGHRTMWLQKRRPLTAYAWTSGCATRHASPHRRAVALAYGLRPRLPCNGNIPGMSCRTLAQEGMGAGK
eukprot:359116-Chlamydomonas_euryale.AAC.7